MLVDDDDYCHVIYLVILVYSRVTSSVASSGGSNEDPISMRGTTKRRDEFSDSMGD